MATDTFVRKTNELEWTALWEATRMAWERRPKKDELAVDPPVSPIRGHLISANIRFLSPLLRELGELLSLPDEHDEYGVLRATRSAYESACCLLIDAAIVAAPNRQIPRGCVSTDSEGGLRVQWIRPNKSVHLVIPAQPDKESYIYHEVGLDYGTERASAGRLAHWLIGID